VYETQQPVQTESVLFIFLNKPSVFVGFFEDRLNVFSVCELLVDSEAPLDVGRAQYWCERAEQLFPHHPTVFRLKEHLLTADGEEDAAELEALIACKLK
jgi:hypothetical protein